MDRDDIARVNELLDLATNDARIALAKAAPARDSQLLRVLHEIREIVNGYSEDA